VLIGLVVVAVIAVGLPLGAWWVGRRSFWTTHRARTDTDFWRDIMRDHDLTPEEMQRLAAAMGFRGWVGDPRLRRAAADWAQRDLDRMERDRREPSAGRRAVVLVTGAACLAVVALVVVRVFLGDAGKVDFLALCAVLAAILVGPSIRWRQRWLVRRNTDAPAGDRR
jgi:hypothetical protein